MINLKKAAGTNRPRERKRCGMGHTLEAQAREKRLLFLDLDGTLLNDEKEITPGNRQALAWALEKGHGVVITTGRPLKSAMDQAGRLGLDRPGCCLIAYNGAVVYDWTAGKQVFSRTLSFEQVNRVFDRMNRMGIHIQTYDRWTVVVEPRCDDEAVRRYCGMIGMEHRVVEDVRTGLTEEPVKILLIDYNGKAELLKAEAWLREHMGEEVDCFFSCDQYLEVVPKGMNKGEALVRLSRELGVPVEKTVAAGDAANDLTMLAAAGIGAAMANGAPEVKAIADYVTERDNNHDGVAEVVERFML